MGDEKNENSAYEQENVKINCIDNYKNLRVIIMKRITYISKSCP